jgi:single-strand DNA-binding protein
VNVVILRGTLSSDPNTRTLPSGDTLVTFEVTTRPPKGPAESVPVAWPKAPERAATLPAGSEVVVTGRIRRRFFRAGGATASRTEVLADSVLSITSKARCQGSIDRALKRVDHLVERS